MRRADVIAVVEEGRVVEQGSHRQLVASGGRYAQLVNTAEVDSYWVKADATDGSDSSSSSSSDEDDAPASEEAAAAVGA